MFTFVIFAVLSFSLIDAKHEWKTPRCKFGDNECLPDVVNYYIKNGGSGIPSMNLIPIDPLFVPEINIIQGSNSPVNIKLLLKNTTFNGFSDLHINRTVGFEKDPKHSKFEIYGFIPLLTLIGQYAVSGSVIVLPVVGNGRSNFTFEGLQTSIKFYPTIEMRKGKEHLDMSKVKVDFETARLYVNFENLFNGDKLLGDTTNTFLNENWRDILNELKPVLKDVMSGIAQTIVKAVFDKFPYEQLFLDG